MAPSPHCPLAPRHVCTYPLEPPPPPKAPLRGTCSNLFTCTPHINWQAGGWPSTEHILVKNVHFIVIQWRLYIVTYCKELCKQIDQ